MQLETVNTAPGADFNNASIRIRVVAPEEGVHDFENKTADGWHANTCTFATRMLPTWRTHYQQVKEAGNQVP